MSHKLNIFGSGDELIETEGDISAEHQVPFDVMDSFVAVSDGAVFKVSSPVYQMQGMGFDDPPVTQGHTGWVVQCLVRGRSDITIGDDGHNDFIELNSEEPFLWVVFGIQLALKELLP